MAARPRHPATRPPTPHARFRGDRIPERRRPRRIPYPIMEIRGAPPPVGRAPGGRRMLAPSAGTVPDVRFPS